MLPSTESPFPQFFDVNGDPLDEGSVYYGLPNTNPVTSPLAVYWDASGTQPVAQPVKTLNGIPVRFGTPANVFTDQIYSISVYDKKGRLIFTEPDSSEFNQLPLLSNTTNAAFGSALIGYKPNMTGSTGRTLSVKLNEIISVKDFGAVGDGVTDDTAAFVLACTAARANTGRVLVPDGHFRIDTGNIDLTGIQLRGAAAPLAGRPSTLKGSTIYLTGTASSPFLFGVGTVVEDLTFYWPNQVNSLTPTAYPALFNSNVQTKYSAFRNLLMINAYRGWIIGSNATDMGGVEMIGIRGFFIDRIATIISASETIRWIDCHFSFGWALVNDPIDQLINYCLINNLGVVCDSGTATYKSVDGLQFSNCWFWALNCCLFVASGNVSGGSIQGGGMDGCPTLVRTINTATTNIFLSVRSVHIIAYFPTMPAAVIAAHTPVFDIQMTQPGQLAISDCLIQGAGGAILNNIGNGLQSINISGCSFTGWFNTPGAVTSQIPAIYIDNNAVSAKIDGCTFVNGYIHGAGIQLSKAYIAAIAGCTFVSCEQPVTIGAITTGRASVAGCSSSNTSSGSPAILTTMAVIESGNAWDITRPNIVKNSWSTTFVATFGGAATTQTQDVPIPAGVFTAAPFGFVTPDSTGDIVTSVDYVNCTTTNIRVIVKKRDGTSFSGGYRFNVVAHQI